MHPKIHGYLRTHSFELGLLNRIIDLLVISISGLALLNILNIKADYYYQSAIILMTSFYLVFAEIRGLYQSLRISNYFEIAILIFTAWINVSALLILIGFITKTSSHFSRIFISSWLLTALLALLINKLCISSLLRFLRRSGKNFRSFAVLGPKERCKRLLDQISLLPWAGLDCKGTYESIESFNEETIGSHIDYVFLAYESTSEAEIIDATNKLSNTTATVFLAPDLFISELLGSKWVMFGNLPMISIYDHPFYGSQLMLKRLEDYILSTIILIIISPVLIAIGLAVKMSSKGPILFQQRRYGLNGETIEVYKFRTMNVLEDGELITQAGKNDLRVTTLGRFLRRTSLDELPQFLNVLKGDMSIVGPRPHAIAHNEYYRKLIHGYMLRHKVKPGITGWAQINGFRGETETLDKMQSRVEYDLFYINNWTLGLDLKIILLTIFKGFIHKSAY